MEGAGEKKCEKTPSSKSLREHFSRERVLDNFREYSRSSSVHGIKYLTEGNRPLSERFCWIMAFIVCCYMNGFLIGELWNKWTRSPVIVTFAETSIPIWKVPFPAVTICNHIKCRASEFNFSSHMAANDSSDEDNKRKGAVTLLCDDDVVYEGEDYADESTMDFLFKVSPDFMDTIFICKWFRKVSTNCTDIFTRILTDEGICYSFNMLDKSDLFRPDVLSYFESDGLRARGWTLETGYDDQALLDTYPRRALMPGAGGSALFTVVAAKPEDSDDRCRGPVKGFKVILHNPAEFPLVGERYLRLPLSQEVGKSSNSSKYQVLAMIQPNLMTVSDELRGYDAHVRHCFFPNERELSFFRVYTQPSCELECLTNYTLRECGCVALHMPRRIGTPLCGPGKKKCMVNAAKSLRMSEITSTHKNNAMVDCDCLPSCVSISYDAQPNQADYNYKEVLEAYGENLTQFEGVESSRLSIFFKETSYSTVSKKARYETAAFLASSGGLIGLFCGGSFLSIVELMYYTTIRFWYNGNQKKKQDKPMKKSK